MCIITWWILQNLFLKSLDDFKGLKLRSPSLEVYLNVYTDNLRANRFYQKAGFVYEGCSKDAVCVRGVFKSLNWYGIIGD